MTTDEGFLADICDHPENDTPRLIYADWLDEREIEESSARAELIRVQCQLAKMMEEDDHWRELKRRERALLDEWELVWVQPLRKHFTRMEFRRGFVERITLKASRFLRQEKNLFQVAPISHLTLTNLRSLSEAVAQCAGLARLRSLDINEYTRDAELRALLKSPHLSNLTTLMIYSGVGMVLEAATQLGRLQTLVVLNEPLGEEGSRELAGSPLLNQLTGLCVQPGRDWDQVALTLAASPHSRRLEELNLGNVYSVRPDEAVAALLQLPNLRALYIQLNHESPESFRKRFADPRLRLA